MTEKQPLKVGITGGIGSGKSVVCRLFSMLGVPVYDTDARARLLMASDAVLAASIRKRFGEESYRGGLPDRAFLAGKVFADREALAALNGLVHPAVIRDFNLWAASCRCAYVIVESAILYESGMYRHTDTVVTVSAPESLRAARAALRDGCEPDRILLRMQNQMTDAEREAMAGRVIFNDEHHLVWEQVLSLNAVFRSGEAAGTDPGCKVSR